MSATPPALQEISKWLHLNADVTVHSVPRDYQSSGFISDLNDADLDEEAIRCTVTAGALENQRPRTGYMKATRRT